MSLSVPKLASYLAALLRENPTATDDDLWTAAGAKHSGELWELAVERARALVPEPRRKRKERAV